MNFDFSPEEEAFQLGLMDGGGDEYEGLMVDQFTEVVAAMAEEGRKEHQRGRFVLYNTIGWGAALTLLSFLTGALVAHYLW